MRKDTIAIVRAAVKQARRENQNGKYTDKTVALTIYRREIRSNSELVAFCIERCFELDFNAVIQEENAVRRQMGKRAIVEQRAAQATRSPVRDTPETQAADRATTSLILAYCLPSSGLPILRSRVCDLNTMDRFTNFILKALPEHARRVPGAIIGTYLTADQLVAAWKHSQSK